MIPDCLVIVGHCIVVTCKAFMGTHYGHSCRVCSVALCRLQVKQTGAFVGAD